MAPAKGNELLAAAREVFDIESEALAATRDGLNDDSFLRAVEIVRDCKGKTVCGGVGKSGHIARKAAATLASTGAPSFYLHPTEAGHGDAGALSAGDAMLAFSYSGSGDEWLSLLPSLRRLQIPLIAVAGDENSPLAKAADAALIVRVRREACPLNLAPTASSTAMLATADALAMAVLRARGFSSDRFALAHPAGALGRRLLTQVADVMRGGEAMPVVGGDDSFSRALVEMTGKRMGMTLVADGGELRGIFTDGDLRRAVESGRDLSGLTVAELMTPSPQTAAPAMLAADALKLMREHKIGHLAVLHENKLVGALSFHDLLAHRLV